MSAFDELMARYQEALKRWVGEAQTLPEGVTARDIEKAAILEKWRREDPVSYAQFVEGKLHEPKAPDLKLIPGGREDEK